MAVPQGWVAKSKPSLPPHYYEGFLEKKRAREPDYKRYWAGLRGLNLYLYNTSRDTQYAEKINLAEFVSLSDDTPLRSAATWSVDGAKLNLKLRSHEVKLKMESLESRELWKGFILTVVEMKIPSGLNLLPGHIYMLSEALEKEKEQRSKAGQTEPRSDKDLPECFFRVSRTEAEVLLEKNENCGNMLLRPGGDGKSVSVTTRQKVNGVVSIKHYKINVVGGEYVIDVEKPYRCDSLADVVDFFVTSSKRILVPLCLDESYAMTLEIMETDRESGESALVPPRMPSVSTRLPKAPPPAGKKSLQLPGVRFCLPAALALQKPPPVLPSGPPIPSWSPMPENEYEEEEEPDQTYVNDEEVAEMRQINTREFKSKPAIEAPRKSSPGLRKPVEIQSPRMAMTLPRNLSVGMTEELERKLKERRANLES